MTLEETIESVKNKYRRERALVDANKVARAAEWMDRESPGWAHRVNPLTLNMNDIHDCIMGQSFKWPRWKFWMPLRYGSGYRAGRARLAKTGGGIEQVVFAWGGYKDYWINEIVNRVVG